MEIHISQDQQIHRHIVSAKIRASLTKSVKKDFGSLDIEKIT